MPQIAARLRHDYHHILSRVVAGVREGCRMQVAIELFGIPRSRAGLAHTTATGANVGDVLADLASHFPQLAETCIDGRTLRPGFIVNVNAERFVTSPEMQLRDGDTLLLMSLDAGG
jgi:molybdopterin converting factor small subunit